jgi:hypothetical protein
MTQLFLLHLLSQPCDGGILSGLGERGDDRDGMGMRWGRRRRWKSIWASVKPRREVCMWFGCGAAGFGGGAEICCANLFFVKKLRVRGSYEAGVSSLWNKYSIAKYNIYITYIKRSINLSWIRLSFDFVLFCQDDILLDGENWISALP